MNVGAEGAVAEDRKVAGEIIGGIETAAVPAVKLTSTHDDSAEQQLESCEVQGALLPDEWCSG